MAFPAALWEGAMNRAPHRVEQHNGHEIKVWVFVDVARGGFIGMYEVYGPKHTRTVLLDNFLVGSRPRIRP